ncbi:hypothetical protein AGMMS49960_21820 [Betaproteobacteria bacterium]|nr:hypothetical protein AGMMS49543_27650 [Betaproteobacteria bacterium]GHU05424.1 hypothetical protein AGMMS49960_21820 [Betaproteobacteria bacterium]GHU21531.1 hypothetical protein AGMMS50243_19410 [Betaproteobacteria bacterium]
MKTVSHLLAVVATFGAFLLPGSASADYVNFSIHDVPYGHGYIDNYNASFNGRHDGWFYDQRGVDAVDTSHLNIPSSLTNPYYLPGMHSAFIQTNAYVYFWEKLENYGLYFNSNESYLVFDNGIFSVRELFEHPDFWSGGYASPVEVAPNLWKGGFHFKWRFDDTPYTFISAHIVFSALDGSSVYGSGPGTSKIAAIPEPATPALLLAGLGLLGFVAQRRSRARI